MNPLLPRALVMPSVGATGDPRRICYYGCVRCQRTHVEGSALFLGHLGHQSKHGVRSMGRDAYWRHVGGKN